MHHETGNTVEISTGNATSPEMPNEHRSPTEQREVNGMEECGGGNAYRKNANAVASEWSQNNAVNATQQTTNTAAHC
jgi:hypothetical protein